MYWFFVFWTPLIKRCLLKSMFNFWFCLTTKKSIVIFPSKRNDTDVYYNMLLKIRKTINTQSWISLFSCRYFLSLGVWYVSGPFWLCTGIFWCHDVPNRFLLDVHIALAWLGLRLVVYWRRRVSWTPENVTFNASLHSVEKTQCNKISIRKSLNTMADCMNDP